MKSTFLIVALMLTLLQHTEPPPGWTCSPRGWTKNGKQTTEHPCLCQRIDYDEFCEGTPLKDAVCKVYCYEHACGCPPVCKPGQGPMED